MSIDIEPSLHAPAAAPSLLEQIWASASAPIPPVVPPPPQHASVEQLTDPLQPMQADFLTAFEEVTAAKSALELFGDQAAATVLGDAADGAHLLACTTLALYVMQGKEGGVPSAPKGDLFLRPIGGTLVLRSIQLALRAAHQKGDAPTETVLHGSQLWIAAHTLEVGEE